MTTIPDFTTLDWRPSSRTSSEDAAAAVRMTPEGIPITAFYDGTAL